MQSSSEDLRGPSIIERVHALLRHVPPFWVYLFGLGWAVWLFWLGATGGLGAEPINALERAYGDCALKLLVIGLAITPLRRFLGLNLLRYRRALGLACFSFALAHLLVWAILDVGKPSLLWTEVTDRPYITAGMFAFLCLIPLALTSNNRAISRMGTLRWRNLHRLVYPAAAAAALHQWWVAKSITFEHLAYTAAILALLVIRVPVVDRSLRRLL